MRAATIRTLLAALFTTFFAPAVMAARLMDGTRLQVRLVHVISSETSTIGDALEFVVTRDVVANGDVVVSRRTRAAGTLVDVARVQLGFFTHSGRLAFSFDRTTARDGQVIRLRASPMPRPDNRVV